MSHEALPEFGISKNIKQVGRTDLPEGGLVNPGRVKRQSQAMTFFATTTGCST